MNPEYTQGHYPFALGVFRSMGERTFLKHKLLIYLNLRGLSIHNLLK